MILCRVMALAAVLVAVATGDARAQGLSVEVSITGVSDSVAGRIRPYAQLTKSNTRYNALAPIRRDANEDAETLLAALRTNGYYAASVTPSLRRVRNVVRVNFEVTPGPRFSIGDYRIIYLDDQKDPRPQTFEEAGIATTGAPTGEAMNQLTVELLTQLRNAGYLGARMENQEVRANFAEETAAAIFEVRTGPKSYYGEILVTGTEKTETDYVRQYRTFEYGELAQKSDLDKYRDRLVGTGLFNEVDVQPAPPTDDGITDVRVRLAERDRRTLGGGVSFATDVGPGFNVFWENRNLLGRGETLRTEIQASEPIQEGMASFRKPRPRLPGYYILGAALRNEDTEAFKAQTARVGGSLAKQWLNEQLTLEGGLGFVYSDIEERDCLADNGAIIEPGEGASCESAGGTIRGRSEFFRAVTFPVSLAWDSQDNPLNPRQGFLAGAQVTPFVGSENFQRFEVYYADRVFWGKKDWGTFAGRTKLGATYGADRAAIPATERFYAGGGGSIRGFAFQEASPIDPSTGEILGGASIAEFNVELRQFFTESIEIAVFTDFGGAFESNTPNFEQMLVAAGLGVRYHTPIGPFRVDVAFPVDRRQLFIDDGPDEDDQPDQIFRDTVWQLYIGLGQPF